MANLKTILDEKIEKGFDKLETLDIGTKEYNDAVDGLGKLMDRRIEIEKNKEESKSRLGKNIIDIGLGLAGLGVSIWGMCVSIQFEKDDSFTSQVGKKAIDRILRK